MWSTAGCLQIATGKPKRGAPNVTHTVTSRTAVAEMVQHVTYSERAQMWRYFGPNQGAPNVTHMGIFATGAFEPTRQRSYDN